ncbi:hypothetical protein CAPTEDRAFT_105148, partial [Capitella teleta]
MDCPDGDDELECGDCTPAPISNQTYFLRQCDCSNTTLSPRFQCRDGACISMAKVCDCTKDCTDGSDEFCSRDICLSSGYSIPYKYVCDGIKDCPNGRDENYCTQDHCKDLFRCKGDGICIHPAELGDGISDCPMSRDD